MRNIRQLLIIQLFVLIFASSAWANVTAEGNIFDQIKTFTLDGKDYAASTSERKYFFLLTLEEMDIAVSKTLHFTLTNGSYTLRINDKEVTNGSTITFPAQEVRDYTISVYNSSKRLVADGTIVFTCLPLVQIYRDEGVSFSTSFKRGKFRVHEFNETTSGELLNAEVRYRGATASTYSKKAFAIKLLDDEGIKTERSYFGLRNDNYWILDAMAMDHSRMRNRVSTDIWNDFATPPHYKNLEKNALNGTRGQYVEVFIDDEYNGLYCMTERIDRKQLKLEKYDDDSGEIRGILYKAIQWSFTVMWGQHGSNDTSQIPSYSNSRDTWTNYEYKYPDLEDGQSIDWGPLYNIIEFVMTSDTEDFVSQITNWADIPVWADYQLLMDLITPTDNHGKNLYYYIYDIANNTPLGITPWDMDGVFGRKWDRSKTATNFTFYEFMNYHGNGPHHLYKRLMEENPAGYKELLKKRYDKLRFTHFAPENVMKRFEDYLNLFKKSGAAAREKARWDGSNSVEINFDKEMTYLEDWIYEHADYLNQHYGDPVVIRVNSVTLNQSSISILEGNNMQLVATVLPEDADDKTVTWSSNNEEVATVNATGLVSALSGGEAIITVTTNDGSHKATCSFTVIGKTISVTGVSLNANALTLITGNTSQLIATVEPDNAGNKSVVWTSNNEEVATVSDTGLVSACAEGEAIITVTTNDKAYTATCNIKVEDPVNLIDTPEEATITISNGMLSVENAPEASLVVLNVQGTVVAQSDNNHLYTNNLPKGVYIIRVVTQKEFHNKKFIIK